MAVERLEIKVKESQAGTRLDQFLAQVLPEHIGRDVSKAKIRKLIVAGAVYLNRARVRISSRELRAGARIEIYLDQKRLFEKDSAERDVEPAALTQADVLFEDEYIIAISKPAGVPTQPTLDQGRTHLFGMVKALLADREKCPIEKIYVGLHHRLDRDTSGVILFTKRKEANPGVARLFKERLVEKTYYAYCEGLEIKAPPESWVTKNFLASYSPPGAAKKGKKMRSVRSGGDVAETAFRVLKREPPYFLIEAKPKTGRMHQIRVHLGEAGYPIVGDRLYGWRPTAPADVAGKWAKTRVLLHAGRLCFPHPISGERIDIQSPMPFE